MKGSWHYEPWVHGQYVHGWYFYPERGGFFFLPGMKWIATLEKGGKAVGLVLTGNLEDTTLDRVVLPPLPKGVDLTTALR